MRYRSWALTRRRGGNDCSGLLRRFDEVSVGKVGAARRRLNAAGPVRAGRVGPPRCPSGRSAGPGPASPRSRFPGDQSKADGVAVGIPDMDAAGHVVQGRSRGPDPDRRHGRHLAPQANVSSARTGRSGPLPAALRIRARRARSAPADGDGACYASRPRAQPRRPVPSISTSISGFASAETSIREQAGKSPSKNSLRARQTASRKDMSVTKIVSFSMSFIEPPAASR